MATWQAAEARHRFSDVVDAAVSGEPQIVRRRDGREVVVVSKEYFERTRPNLKTFLLTQGYADEGEDAFDRAMQDIRAEGSAFFRPRKVDI
jgi:prevent-host-death family protein